jgi:hypothetical protein
VCHAWDKTNAYSDLGESKEKDATMETDVGGRVRLRWTVEKQDGVTWTGFVWLRVATSGGLF